MSRDDFRVYLWQDGERLRASDANSRNYNLSYEVKGRCPVTATTTTATTTTTVSTTPSTEWDTLTDKITPGLATCGASENKMTKKSKSPKIINGVEVIENSWPWIVGIVSRSQAQVDAESSNGWICSGTIIDDRWILTAAHCCEGGAEHTLYFGDHQRGIFDETGNEQIMIADTVVIHPQRDAENLNFDACLLRTSRSIGIGTSAGVAAACLPTESPKHGEACWVAGWGRTETGDLSNELKSVGVNIFSDEYCAAHHFYGGFLAYTNPDEICAGLPDSDDADNLSDGGKGACKGDSGGPLVCDRDGVLTLAGIVSYNRGFGCAEEGRPGMYGDVFEYNDWIRETINN